jgi:hypothetical protein
MFQKTTFLWPSYLSATIRKTIARHGSLASLVCHSTGQAIFLNCEYIRQLHFCIQYINFYINGPLCVCEYKETSQEMFIPVVRSVFDGLFYPTSFHLDKVY